MTVIWIQKQDGKLAENSRDAYKEAWETLPDGGYKIVFEPTKRGYTPTRYKYYFGHVLEVILLTCGKKFEVWKQGKFRTVKNIHEIHDALKTKYNGILMSSPLGAFIMAESTTEMSDSEFINQFEEIIIADFSAPPFSCDSQDRETWAEMMKAKKGI